MTSPRLRLDRDPEAPILWAVWTLGEEAEIIGAGDTAGEALAAARRTLETWRAARLAQHRRNVSVLAFTRSR